MMDQDNITWTGARVPGVGGVTHRVAVHYRAHGPAQYGTTDVGYAMHERRRQTKRRPAYAGSRLKLTDALGRSRLISQPSRRNGQAKRLSSIKVDSELERGRLLHRQIGGLGTLQYLIHIARSTPIQVRIFWPV